MAAANQRVLVTGGARGIGAHTAQKFVDQGAEVAIWTLHESSIEEARQNINGDLFAQAVDVGSPENVQVAAKQLREDFGPIDILINNAGYTQTTPFLSEEPSYWERVVATNLWGVIYTTRAFLDDMVDNGQGAIVNVVSDAARAGMSGEAVYAASKGGVISFSKSIAREVAKKGVRINCVSPGPTRTDTLTDNSDGDSKNLIDKMLKQIPMRAIAEPEQVAESIAFLGSDAAAHITGQVLSVSGGLTMSD